jgi:hypothetical protein
LEDPREPYVFNQPDSDDSGQIEDVVHVARVFPVPNPDHLTSTNDRTSTIQSRGVKRDSRETPAPKYDFHDDSDDVIPRTTSRKGLFSVSTTSTKYVTVIRVDVIWVLRQLGVDHTDIWGGFICRHVPTIYLKRLLISLQAVLLNRDRVIGAELLPGALILAKAQIGPAKAR